MNFQLIVGIISLSVLNNKIVTNIHSPAIGNRSAFGGTTNIERYCLIENGER